MNNDQTNQRASYDQAHRIDLENYVPDMNKKYELKRRQYDTGVSNVPLPSVKRPIEEHISSKPYSAKMNPNKIQSQSPLKKKIDSITKNIYSHIQENYKEAAAQEAKYKGEGTADYYKSQHVMVPPAQVFQDPKKGKSRLVPTIKKSTEGGSTLAGLSSTNRILLNKGGKANQLAPLGKTS